MQTLKLLYRVTKHKHNTTETMDQQYTNIKHYLDSILKSWGKKGVVSPPLDSSHTTGWISNVVITHKNWNNKKKRGKVFFLFLKIFVLFLKRFTIFTKRQLYNNKITIATTTRSSLLELFLKAGAPQKYTK